MCKYQYDENRFLDICIEYLDSNAVKGINLANFENFYTNVETCIWAVVSPSLMMSKS